MAHSVVISCRNIAIDTSATTNEDRDLFLRRGERFRASFFSSRSFLKQEKQKTGSKSAWHGDP